ncbi:hypothetical protein O3G_MSEX015479, partial [Manduca sexta]
YRAVLDVPGGDVVGAEPGLDGPGAVPRRRGARVLRARGARARRARRRVCAHADTAAIGAKLGAGPVARGDDGEHERTAAAAEGAAPPPAARRQPVCSWHRSA